jgi:hypothetical protein
MKMLTTLGILMIVFTSCGTLTPQETQQKRERLLAAYDAARQRQNPERIKKAVKGILVGEWQYVGLEVVEDDIIAQRAEPLPQQTADASDTTNEQETAQDVSNPEESKQALEGNTTRLPQIEVTDEKSDQQILAAKAALVASTRQNLTLEFFEDRSSYFYNSNNGAKSATGQCYITTKRYGDDALPYISFNRRTGPEMIEFLFGSEPVKWRGAKEREKKISMRRNVTPITGARRNRTLTSPPVRPPRYQEKSTFMPSITVTDDRLYLVLHGYMSLTPSGWARTGGLRCIFKRVE